VGSTHRPVAGHTVTSQRSNKVTQRLNQVWLSVLADVPQIHQAASIGPTSSYSVFTVSDDGGNEVQVVVKPIVLNVPEKGKSQQSGLFVVIEGWLNFDAGSLPNLVATTFGTQVAYFRQKSGSMAHIYGVHYDVDEASPGHPVFHSQMKSMLGMSGVIPGYKAIEIENNMDGVLGTVRIPTAQMDVFSVIEQVCADHLIWKNSADGSLSAFKKLRSTCDFFRGSGGRHSRLTADSSVSCFRSTHWYADSLLSTP
jgi:hypothetical protein